MAVINRQLEIRFPNNDYNTITAKNIVSESMVIQRSICDDNFKLGGCIASSFEIQLIGISPYILDGKRIQAVLLEYTDEEVVTLTPSETLYPAEDLHPGRTTGEPIETPLFTGTIDSAVRQKNRQIIKITAYDDIYTIMQMNVYTWFAQRAYYASGEILATIIENLFEVPFQDRIPYLTRWQSTNTNTNYNTVTQLSNALVQANYEASVIASEVLRSANELMGVFGYITGSGRYTTISLAKSKTYNIDTFVDLEFEEYKTAEIDIVSFTYNGGERFNMARASKTNCCYLSEDNVITNCIANRSNVKTLVTKLTQGVGGIADGSCYMYTPFTLILYKDMLPTGIGLGSKVHINTGSTAQDDIKSIDSIIFAEKITGIQALKYEFSATGDKILGGCDTLAGSD